VCPTIDVQYIDPKESGAVIPILHVNGYKIGERTIPGTMDNLEIACLYTGYGITAPDSFGSMYWTSIVGHTIPTYLVCVPSGGSWAGLALTITNEFNVRTTIDSQSGQR
jgi:hypothetical protein